jgi:hypothetical protein
VTATFASAVVLDASRRYHLSFCVDAGGSAGNRQFNFQGSDELDSFHLCSDGLGVCFDSTFAWPRYGTFVGMQLNLKTDIVGACPLPPPSASPSASPSPSPSIAACCVGPSCVVR